MESNNPTVRTVTILVPTFNNEWAILPLWQKFLKIVMASGQVNWRFLFVDDCSTDKTVQRINDLIEDIADYDISLIKLRRHYGLTQALQAGFDHCTGDYVVTLGADLQYEPADIPLMIERLEDGVDVCAGWRRVGQGGRLARQKPNRIMNWAISKVSGLRLHDYDCSLRAYRVSVVQDLHLSGNLDRYIPVYVSWRGGRVVEVPVTGLPPSQGVVSRESVARRGTKTLLDLVFLKFLQRYSAKPFYVFGGMGLVSILGSMVCAAIAIFFKITERAAFIETPLPLLTAMFLLTGILLVSLGIIAEFLIRVYRLQSGKEFYEVGKSD